MTSNTSNSGTDKRRYCLSRPALAYSDHEAGRLYVHPALSGYIDRIGVYGNAIYLVLCAQDQEEPSIRNVARFLGISQPTTRLYFEKLVQVGLLQIHGSADLSNYGARREMQDRREYFLRELRFRDGNRCRNCEAENDLTIDHLYPVSLGGTNDLSNLQLLCRKCNAKKGTAHVDHSRQ